MLGGMLCVEGVILGPTFKAMASTDNMERARLKADIAFEMFDIL